VGLEGFAAAEAGGVVVVVAIVCVAIVVLLDCFWLGGCVLLLLVCLWLLGSRGLLSVIGEDAGTEVRDGALESGFVAITGEWRMAESKVRSGVGSESDELGCSSGDSLDSWAGSCCTIASYW
jgi:hypothetical protein